MRPPGFRRDLRPLHDLREFGRWFGEITAIRIGHIGLSVAAVIDGIRRVADHSWWGILLIAAGMAAPLVPALIFYYGVPERDSSYRGKHSA